MDNSKYRELAESGNISGRSRQAMANGKDRPQEEGGIWEYQLGGGARQTLAKRKGRPPKK